MGCRWMTSKRTRSSFLPALIGAGLAVAVSSTALNAHAQQPAITPTELKAARELFQEAYKDEQEKRYAQALEKFHRVAAVKESASVRYRISSVLEALGRMKEARDGFRALAAAKPTLPANEQEIAGSAAERAHLLDKKIPKLVVRLAENPPPDTRVSVDGAPVPATTTPSKAIELDPGEHTVQATSPTSKPFEQKVTLTEGVETPVVIGLVPAENTPPPPPPKQHARLRRARRRRRSPRDRRGAAHRARRQDFGPREGMPGRRLPREQENGSRIDARLG
jgi:hypothetical protein